MKAWKDEKSIRENLQVRLPDLVDTFFKEGRKGMKVERSWKEMHQFRLCAKEFRYTLELFQPFYDATLEARLESVRKIQQFLGDINDAVATRKLIKQLGDGKAVRDKLAKRAEGKVRALRRYWKVRFDVDGEQQRWKDYLFQNANRAKESSEQVHEG